MVLLSRRGARQRYDLATGHVAEEGRLRHDDAIVDASLDVEVEIPGETLNVVDAVVVLIEEIVAAESLVEVAVGVPVVVEGTEGGDVELQLRDEGPREVVAGRDEGRVGVDIVDDDHVHLRHHLRAPLADDDVLG